MQLNLWTDAEGLSPRVRGNRLLNQERHGDIRSIPACAGEPGSCAAAGAGLEVYPRVCGGTLTGSCALLPAQGLSPRVRGNLALNDFCGGGMGSIPACAGEP